MLYKDILDINKNFQYSVNIEYDLHNEEKIKEYIPTSDVCDVLKQYIKSVLGYEKNRATLLVGPYGKGKSFLILSLLRIICFESNKYTNTLIEKIKKVDTELYKYIKEIHNKKVKLLPIIIDSNYYNIEQAFLLALNESLKAFGLDEIVPNTVFDVCLELINKWESNEEIGEIALSKCLKQTGTSLKSLKEELKKYNKEAYYKFENLYNCLTPGLEFNPMVNSDIVKTYSDINNQIKEKGYCGIFIVYDEFSKTLEARNNYLAHDLKVIQDFAEKSTRSSDDEQMNLCCITHKVFDLYYKEDGTNDLSDAFRTVSGRFKEIRFNRSLDQNYQIISFTLNKKNPAYEATCEKYIKKNENFYKEISGSSFFDNDDEEILFKNCFPFNPLAVYSLIRLSELIAQNERTMFTLISDTDEYSFNSFISNNSSGLYNTYNLYDYFSQLLQNENEELKGIWYKCETACKKVISKDKKELLKTLAIIEMLNDYSKLPPTVEMLALMTSNSIEIVKKKISEMIDDRIIKKSLRNNYIDFAYSYTKEIDEAVERYIAAKRSGEKESKILSDISFDNYVIPRKYNANYKMTRFYKTIFLDENEFLNLSSFAILFEENYCDGLVIKLINKKNSVKCILNHFEEMDRSENVVIIIPSESTDIIVKEALKLKALISIRENHEIDKNIINQTELMISEKTKELNTVIDSIYNDGAVTYLSDSSEKTLLNIVTDLCEKNYYKTPIVNNEMLNKNCVTTAYQKPRNTIINMILNRENNFDIFSASSPEITIYNSFFLNGELYKDSNKIVSLIKEELLKKYKEKNYLYNIINKLSREPYGLRKGVLPVYLSLAIANMDDNIILCFENVEVDINAINIDKACQNPEQYSFVVEEKSKAQDEYLKKMVKLFGGASTDSFYLNTKAASSLLKKWAIGQPMIIKETRKENNYLKLPDRFIELKNLLLKFNLNPYELLIKEIPSVFDNDYMLTISSIESYLNATEYIEKFINTIAKKIKDSFVKGYKGSIASCYKQWEISSKIDFTKVVFEGKGKDLQDLLRDVNHDNINAVNQIAILITGCSVMDWANNNEDKLYSVINEFVESSKKKENRKIKQNNKISSMGKMFQNNIESIVDEFADSITNEEKVEVLQNIINKYTGGKR